MPNLSPGQHYHRLDQWLPGAQPCQGHYHRYTDRAHAHTRAKALGCAHAATAAASYGGGGGGSVGPDIAIEGSAQRWSSLLSVTGDTERKARALIRVDDEYLLCFKGVLAPRWRRAA
jgi:hypothetical protein